MKIGDMIKFRSTGIVALIIHVYRGGNRNLNSYVDLYSGDEGMPDSGRIISMSIDMARRAGQLYSK